MDRLKALEVVSAKPITVTNVSSASLVSPPVGGSLVAGPVTIDLQTGAVTIDKGTTLDDASRKFYEALAKTFQLNACKEGSATK